jgi:hypothetical protein
MLAAKRTYDSSIFNDSTQREIELVLASKATDQLLENSSGIVARRILLLYQVAKG